MPGGPNRTYLIDLVRLPGLGLGIPGMALRQGARSKAVRILGKKRLVARGLGVQGSGAGAGCRKQAGGMEMNRKASRARTSQGAR